MPTQLPAQPSGESGLAREPRPGGRSATPAEPVSPLPLPEDRVLEMPAGGKGEGREQGTVGQRTLLDLGATLLPPALALAALAIAWETWVRVAGIEEYILPAPSAVARRFLADFRLLISEGLMTTAEALIGFAVGAGIAFLAASLMAASRTLERALFPLAVLVKVTPIVAVAPLLAIWFGFGLAPKLFIVALIVFFPVLVNGVTGLRSVDPAALDFFRSVRASPLDTFVKLRLPSSLPYLFAAFKVSITLSVIGAVVAEWFAGDSGLGRVVQIANYNLDLPLAFAAILMLALIGIALYAAVDLLERRLIPWHHSHRR